MSGLRATSAGAGFVDEVIELLRAHIIDAGKMGAFIVLTSFLITFAMVRIVTHTLRRVVG